MYLSVTVQYYWKTFGTGDNMWGVSIMTNLSSLYEFDLFNPVGWSTWTRSSTILPLKYSFSSACRFPNRGFSDMQLIISASSSAFAAVLHNTPLWRLLPVLFLAAVHDGGRCWLTTGTVFIPRNDAEPPHEMNWSSTELRLSDDSKDIGSPVLGGV